MSDKQFEGHTPAEEWTTYSMGVHADGRLSDKAYHAVRIGREGFDLPITKGADARLIAAAPELLAENRRLKQKVRGLEIAYDSVIDVVNEFIETDYVSDDGAEYLRYNLDLDTQFDAEEFESEFSKGDMLNLKKYIDYPLNWINEKIAPTNERKARKFEQKERGQIPAKREPEDFRQSIKTPTWFKAVQFGILGSVVGLMYYHKESGAIEEPEEPEEQKEE